VLIIRKGCVKVVASAVGGTDVVLGIRGPGDIVGELSGLDGQGRRGTVVALSRVEALVVPGNRFGQLRARSPVLSIAIARVISERLAEADRYRLALGSVGVAPVLARLVLDLAVWYGNRTSEGGLSLELGLTQKDLADCLAVSPRTVARAIAAWRRTGLIDTGRGSMTIPRPDALRRHATPP
jgi:CRP-like cAMP-binding protein